MNIELSKLPDDTSSLKEIITEQYFEYQKTQEKINYLEEMVRLLKNELFGRKSEVRSEPNASQLQLFIPPDASPAPGPSEDIEIKPHTRKKRG